MFDSNPNKLWADLIKKIQKLNIYRALKKALFVANCIY